MSELDSEIMSSAWVIQCVLTMIVLLKWRVLNLMSCTPCRAVGNEINAAVEDRFPDHPHIAAHPVDWSCDPDTPGDAPV